MRQWIYFCVNHININWQMFKYIINVVNLDEK